MSNQDLLIKNDQLNKKNLFLQSLVSRLQEELCRINPANDPAALKSSITDDEDNHAGNASTLPPWIIHEETMSPLLQAYDYRLQGLEDVIEDNRAVIEQQSQKLELLEQKNQQLHKDLQHSMKDLISKMDDAGTETTAHMHAGGGGGSGAPSLELQQELHEKDEYLDVLMTERNLLQDQCSQLQIDLDRHRAVLGERDEALARTAKGLERSVAFVKQLEDDKVELMQHLSVCQEKLQEAAVELAGTRDSQASAGRAHGDLERDAQALRHRVAALEGDLIKQRGHYEAEIDRYEADQLGAVQAARDLTAAVEEKEKRLEEFEDQTHKLQCELTEIKHDCDQMCQVMAGMQSSLVQYASREEETRAVFDESKQKVKEMKLERDQLRTLETQNRQQIARLLAHARDEKAEHDRSTELAMKGVRDKLGATVAARDDEIRQLHLKFAVFREQQEAALRERDDSNRECTALRSAVHDQSHQLDGLFDMLRSRCETAEEAADQARASHADLALALREAEAEAERKVAGLAKELDRQQHLLAAKCSDLEASKSQARDLADERARPVHLPAQLLLVRRLVLLLAERLPQL